MDINTYDLKLKEIDRQIAEWMKTPSGQALEKCKTGQTYNAFGTEYVYIGNKSYTCNRIDVSGLTTLQNQRKALIAEMQKEQQYLKDQFILQQQQATEFARQQALKAAEEVKAAANKSEQELQKAKQELEKAKQELAKAQAAESLAKSVDAGNLESGRILMGINTANKYKLPLLIGGGIIGLGILSFVAYKIFKKK